MTQRTPNVGDNLHQGAHSVGLPPRPFLYTVDQLSVILEVSIPRILQAYLFFDGRSTGKVPKDLMMARNIAPPREKPDWRVSERELVRWMKVKGFKFYERASVRG